MAQNMWQSIFDQDSFVQTFAYAMPETNSIPGDGVITGYGVVSDRLFFTAIQTGDGMGQIQATKIAKIIQLAIKQGAPFIFFMNSQGLRLEENFDALSGYGEILQAISLANSEIPTICVIEGNCIGTAATIASMFDFVIMIEGAGYASVRTGMTQLEYETNCNANACSANGFATIVCKKEDFPKCMEQLINYLPDNASTGTDDYDGCADDPNRYCSYCDSLQTEDCYDVRNVLREISDDQLFFEVWKDYAPSVVTAFARFGGKVTGIVANNTSVENGVIEDAVCKKISVMIDYCDRFSIPLVTLTNTIGLTNDDPADLTNLSASTALLATSYIHADIPKLNIIIGKAYGNSSLLINSHRTGADYVYAWKQASICIGKPEGMALLYYRDQISNAQDPVEARQQAIVAYKEQHCSPVFAAQKAYIDDVISAGETRARIINFIQMMA